MNSKMNVSSDHLFLSNRFRMYLWHEVRSISLKETGVFVTSLPIWILLGMFYREGLVIIFPLFFIESFSYTKLHISERLYLLPISERQLAIFDIVMNHILLYTKFVILFTFAYAGAHIIYHYIPRPEDDWFINLLADPLGIYLRVLVYGSIICWIWVGMSCPSFELSPQKLIWNILFIMVIVQYVHNISSYFWVVLTLSIPVVWVTLQFRKAWRAGDLTKKTLWHMGLAGAGLLALGLLLPPFREDLIGWNLVVACEVIFLMLSPIVIAPMNVRRFRHA